MAHRRPKPLSGTVILIPLYSISHPNAEQVDRGASMAIFLIIAIAFGLLLGNMGFYLLRKADKFAAASQKVGTIVTGTHGVQ